MWSRWFVTLKNVSSRAVTLTADNFPAEIDHSAASPIYFGFADNASGDSWWTQKDYELQPNEEKDLCADLPHQRECLQQLVQAGSYCQPHLYQRPPEGDRQLLLRDR